MTQASLWERQALVVILGNMDIPAYNTLFSSIKLLEGVSIVANLSTLSRETLDLLLLPDDEKIRPAAKRVRKRAKA